jgi:hypothetical protein
MAVVKTRTRSGGDVGCTEHLNKHNLLQCFTQGEWKVQVYANKKPHKGYSISNATPTTTHCCSSHTERRNQYQYWILAAYLVKIGTAIILVVLSPDEHLSQTLPVSQNFVANRCIVVLFGTSFSEYALLNASRKAADDIDAKKCSKMNTRSAREYIMFAPAQLCATGVNSGLATRVTLIRVSRVRAGEFITRERTRFWFHFCSAVRDFCWVAF